MLQKILILWCFTTSLAISDNFIAYRPPEIDVQRKLNAYQNPLEIQDRPEAYSIPSRSAYPVTNTYTPSQLRPSSLNTYTPSQLRKSSIKVEDQSLEMEKDLPSPFSPLFSVFREMGIRGYEDHPLPMKEYRIPTTHTLATPTYSLEKQPQTFPKAFYSSPKAAKLPTKTQLYSAPRAYTDHSGLQYVSSSNSYLPMQSHNKINQGVYEPPEVRASYSMPPKLMHTSSSYAENRGSQKHQSTLGHFVPKYGSTKTKPSYPEQPKEQLSDLTPIYAKQLSNSQPISSSSKDGIFLKESWRPLKSKKYTKNSQSNSLPNIKYRYPVKIPSPLGSLHLSPPLKRSEEDDTYSSHEDTFPIFMNGKYNSIPGRYPPSSEKLPYQSSNFYSSSQSSNKNFNSPHFELRPKYGVFKPPSIAFSKSYDSSEKGELYVIGQTDSLEMEKLYVDRVVSAEKGRLHETGKLVADKGDSSEKERSHLEAVDSSETARLHMDQVDSAEKGKSRMDQVDSAEKGKSRMDQVDSAEKGKSRMDQVDSSEKGKSRMDQVDSAEKGKLHTGRVDSSEKGKLHKERVELSKKENKHLPQVDSSEKEIKYLALVDSSEKRTFSYDHKEDSSEKIKLSYPNKMGSSENKELSYKHRSKTKKLKKKFKSKPKRASGEDIYSRSQLSYEIEDNPIPYELYYKVEDLYSGNNYSHKASSDGHVVKGEYKVLLPDGRTQIVTYVADHETGYTATVRYEGEIIPYGLPPSDFYQNPRSYTNHLEFNLESAEDFEYKYEAPLHSTMLPQLDTYVVLRHA